MEVLLDSENKLFNHAVVCQWLDGQKKEKSPTWAS